MSQHVELWHAVAQLHTEFVVTRSHHMRARGAVESRLVVRTVQAWRRMGTLTEACGASGSAAASALLSTSTRMPPMLSWAALPTSAPAGLRKTIRP